MNGKPEKTFCQKLTDFSLRLLTTPSQFSEKLIHLPKKGNAMLLKIIN